jgi:hypothetical protein
LTPRPRQEVVESLLSVSQYKGNCKFNDSGPSHTAYVLRRCHTRGCSHVVLPVDRNKNLKSEVLSFWHPCRVRYSPISIQCMEDHPYWCWPILREYYPGFSHCVVCISAAKQWRKITATVLFAVLIWLAVSMAMHSFPSTGDAKGIWRTVFDKSCPIMPKIVAIPIVGLI